MSVPEDSPLAGLETCPWCWCATPLDEFCEHDEPTCLGCCPAEHGDPRDTPNWIALLQARDESRAS
jgi:hypothetical protein